MNAHICSVICDEIRSMSEQTNGRCSIRVMELTSRMYTALPVFLESKASYCMNGGLCRYVRSYVKLKSIHHTLDSRIKRKYISATKVWGFFIWLLFRWKKEFNQVKSSLKWWIVKEDYLTVGLSYLLPDLFEAQIRVLHRRWS